MFCGDIQGYYCYKSGSKLVGFFNSYFHHTDEYKQGFPSRWIYVYNKCADFLTNGRFDDFLNVILSKRYLIKDQQCTEVEAIEKAESILAEFNRIVKQDMCTITHMSGKYSLCKENDDLEYIGEGGFAIVYKQKSTGLVRKKLKEDFVTDVGIRSRFKREYNITKTLADVHGIIQVYAFDENNYSYTMEKAETTFEKYIRAPGITDEIRITSIRQILYIMNEVHKRDVIHRDLSPNNIFILNGMIIIADFGLGKDLNVFTSHQTMHTNSVGQYYYCAPEQFMMLRDGDKKSDVYSIGRIINFVLTLDPNNSNHMFRSVAEKATNQNAAYRYADAGQLSVYFEKTLAFQKDAERQKIIDAKIAKKRFDDDVEAYIYELPAEIICQNILDKKLGFADALLTFMKIDETHAQHIINGMESSYQDTCGWTFVNYDPFADFAYTVLNGDFTYVINERAATILRYVAKDVGRFAAQHMIESIKDDGVEPLIEEILDS